MTVGIIVNKKKEDARAFAGKLEKLLLKHDQKVIVSEVKQALSSDISARADFIISIGGDGTFLRAAIVSLERSVPVLGFNLGTLGFLTEFERESLEDTVNNIIAGKYEVEERRVIKVDIVKPTGERSFFSYAINDVVLTRESDANVAYINLDIRGVRVDTYPCDGIIVATQTGSTAYSLSAGGPIVEPGCDMILITPICSHKLGSRSIVARPESEIVLTPAESKKRLILVADGKFSRMLTGGEAASCSLSDKNVKVCRMTAPNFYTTVQNKLMGGGI